MPRPLEGHPDSPASAFAPAAGHDDGAPRAGQAAEEESRPVAATVGNPDAQQIGFARRLRRSIPEELYDAAHGEASAFLLTIALVLDRSGGHVERQLHLVAEQLGSERASAVRRLYGQLTDAGPEYGLPLLEIAFPALKRRPAPQLKFLIDLIRRLVETDGEMDLFEYCFYQVLVGSLGQYGDPERASAGRKVSKREARAAALQLIRIVAHRGHDDPAQREAASRAGAAALGELARGAAYAATGAGDVMQMDRALDALRNVNPDERKHLVDALSATIGHDHRMTVTEGELLRAICASLACPLPPLLAANGLSPAGPGPASSSPAGAEEPH
jgi:hypothetical protein